MLDRHRKGEAKMKRVVISVTIFLLVVGTFGCATIPLESESEKLVSMTKVREDQVRDFVIQKQAYWIFWGLVPVTRPDVDGVVKSQADGHTGVQNLKVTAKHSLPNYILTLLTLSFVHSKTFIFEGEVYD